MAVSEEQVVEPTHQIADLDPQERISTVQDEETEEVPTQKRSCSGKGENSVRVYPDPMVCKAAENIWGRV